jgi:ribosomal subunit interface protein
MQVPLEITFHQVQASEAVEDYVRKHAEKLERHHPRIIRCRVAIEEPHRRHRTGNRFDVHLEVSVPGKMLTVVREPGELADHQDVYQAVRDAFVAMERQLEGESRARRGEVKTHEEQPRGVVARMLPEDDCGFIETANGREIYFHRNSVQNGGFDHLSPGMSVKFVESESGVRGPQASAVFPTTRR